MNKEVKYSCPSNIALVKYWGKKESGTQLPANPSISWTLNDLRATTRMVISPVVNGESPTVKFYLANKEKPSFLPKIETFLKRVTPEFGWISEHHFEIYSENNFPHGAGIASSAAGFGALASCLVALDGQWEESDPVFWEKASKFARLGSGSACRSVYNEPGLWGEFEEVLESTDDFAIPYSGSIHPNLQGWKDAVLIIEDGEKSVSSTAGHALLKEHAYAEARYKQAHKSLSALLSSFKTGDVQQFIEIVESEALQLHAMMMSSIPYYVLMKPNTLEAIEKIWKHRNETLIPMCFTLDAGANVHLLYDGRYHEQIQNFINTELLPYCQNGLYLCSDTGGKPIKL